MKARYGVYKGGDPLLEWVRPGCGNAANLPRFTESLGPKVLESRSGKAHCTKVLHIAIPDKLHQ